MDNIVWKLEFLVGLLLYARPLRRIFLCSYLMKQVKILQITLISCYIQGVGSLVTIYQTTYSGPRLNHTFACKREDAGYGSMN